MTGNRGEWSEIYVLFRVLGQGRIYASDEKAQKIKNIYYPIMKIIRDELKNKHCEYCVCDTKKIEIHVNGNVVKTLPAECFETEADKLFDQILKGKNAFGIPDTQCFMESVYCNSIKAPSSNKTDITMQIHDIHTGYNPICGFSIKSELGNSPTLLNASEATNFVFCISNFDKELIGQINAIATKWKYLERFAEIEKSGGVHSFEKLWSSVFYSNLLLVDSKMPEILAYCLLYRMKFNYKNVKDVVELLEKDNPLKFPREGFYKYKMKKFLCACALGMNPAKKWDGIDEANGGYIIVSKQGEVLLFHIYNRNSFEQYLFDNTYFEAASGSRHEYGSLYEENNQVYIKWNIQIRFLEKKAEPTYKITDSFGNLQVAES